MFATLEGTIDQALERRREARRLRVRSLYEREAMLQRELMEVVREAQDEGDCEAAGCSSTAQWLAQISSSDYRSAARITSTSDALRNLPELEQALSDGVLNLDQVAAAAPLATPGTDAELARIAVGKAPGAIAIAARKLTPPAVQDDEALYERRALSLSWTAGRRELVFSGRLPLEQGVVFEQAVWDVAKQLRAVDKRAGTLLEWHQYTADALVGLARHGASDRDGGIRRSPTTLVVHISRNEPPMLEGAGAISPETAELFACDARRLMLKPHGRDLVHSRVGRCASYAQLRALYKRAGGHCQYPGCSATRELQAHHLVADDLGGKAELDNLILICPRHHKLLHDRHIRTSGPGEHPLFADASGRAITTNQPHAPPS